MKRILFILFFIIFGVSVAADQQLLELHANRFILWPNGIGSGTGAVMTAGGDAMNIETGDFGISAGGGSQMSFNGNSGGSLTVSGTPIFNRPDNLLAPVSYTEAVLRQAVRVATTANGTLGSSFANGQTIDGVTLATGNLILIKNQSSVSDNGMYKVNGSGAPTRVNSMSSWAEVVNAVIVVEAGTVNAHTEWISTVAAGGTLGSTAITFRQIGVPNNTTANQVLTSSSTAVLGFTTLNAGSYTPTLTGVSNVASSSANVAQYVQVSNRVIVTGSISVTPTLTATATSIGVSLPVASNFTATADASGTATSAALTSSGGVLADATNDRAQLNYLSVSLSADTIYFSFSYLVQ